MLMRLDDLYGGHQRRLFGGAFQIDQLNEFEQNCPVRLKALPQEWQVVAVAELLNLLNFRLHLCDLFR